MKQVWIAVLACALVGCSSAPSSRTTGPADAKTGLISETTASPEALDHFHKGEALVYNLRTEEAATELDQALQLDSGFVLARAFHAQTQTGERAVKEADEAAAAAGNLPDAERLFVQANSAVLRGDTPEAESLLRQLTASAPQDWRSHFVLGSVLLNEQKYDDAVSSLKKATELKPDAGVALNLLGYASLRQGDTAGAVTAFEQYTKVLPQEPNPQDSLGEALLAAGRFQEAEAAFGKALMLAPRFWNAHEGLAFARFYQGNWAGGTMELEQAKAGASDAGNKVGVDREIAFAAAAQGRTADALKVLDGSEKMFGADRSVTLFLPVYRAQVLIAGGQPKQAIAALAPALAAADDQGLPAGIARGLRTQALRVRVTAEAIGGDATGAEATAALLRNEASARTNDPAAQRASAFANGMVAVAKKDFAGARAEFDKCSREDDVCQWQRITALERTGNKDETASARDQWMRMYKRDPEYLMARSQIARTARRVTE